MLLKGINKQFTNRITIIVTTVFLLLIVLVALYGLSQVNERLRRQNLMSLQTILNSTHETIHDVWLNGLFLEANSRASESVVLNSAKALLAISHEQSALLKHPAQQKLRDYFSEYLKQRDAFGIFIISPDATNLASMRDSNIGQQNLISQYYPERLERVFSGQQQLIPPIPSEVPLQDGNDQMVSNYPTMFILVPIKNKQGRVLAALSVRLNPFGTFTKIAHAGRIGESGETYLFDRQGRMITESRFNEQLWQLGLLTQGNHSVLNLHVHEQANNLKEVGKFSNKLHQQLQTKMAKEIIAKPIADNTKAYQDYRGVPVLGVETWDEDLGIGFVTEIDEYEALESYRQMQAIVIGMLIGIMFLGAIFFYIMNRIRQQSMAEVANSEAYLSVVLDNAIDGIVTINKKGIIQTFNHAAEQLFGYSQSEVINKNVSILIPEPHKSQHDHYLENYQTTGEAKIIDIGREVEALRKDGSCFPVRLGISEIKSGNERIYTAILHDLTEKKKQEEALFKSEKNLADAQRITHNGSWDWDIVNDKLYWSDEQYRLWGLEPQKTPVNYEIFFNSLHVEDRVRVENAVKSAFEQQEGYKIEYRVIAPDGKERLLYVEGVVHFDEDDKPVRMVGITLDVTERKKTEQKIKCYQEELETLVEERTEKLNEKTIELQNEHEKLLKNERLYRGLLEAAPDSIILVNEQGIIELINETVTKMFGYTNDELYGQPVEMMLPKQYINNHKKLREQYIKSPYVRESHTVNMLFGRHKDGSEFPVDISLSPMKTEKETMIICDIRDITERIKLGEQLQQAQKMEAIGQLTGGIAHDFNNMLSGILGYTDLALDLGENPKKEKLEEYLKSVRKAGERARDLIANMMAFSRTSPVNTNQLLNLTQLLDETINMLRPILPSSIDIVCEIDSDVPEIMGDSAQIIQVVINLCVNARDALQEHGGIQLQLRKAILTDHVCNSCRDNITGDFIEISVTDNGTGIDVETLNNIFDPFYTTKEVGKGTGMGLSMVHGIVHDSGGHIIVDSAIGEGTTFRLLFPCVEIKKPENKPVTEKFDDEIMGNGQHVLVVDDEEIVGIIIEELLTGRDYKITRFTDSADALDYFFVHQDEIDMVITDQTMPNITGAEMARAMLEVRKDLPIVLATGYSLQVDEKIAKSIGIKSFLSKPIDSKILLREVNGIFYD